MWVLTLILLFTCVLHLSVRTYETACFYLKSTLNLERQQGSPSTSSAICTHRLPFTYRAMPRLWRVSDKPAAHVHCFVVHATKERLRHSGLRLINHLLAILACRKSYSPRRSASRSRMMPSLAVSIGLVYTCMHASC